MRRHPAALAGSRMHGPGQPLASPLACSISVPRCRCRRCRRRHLQGWPAAASRRGRHQSQVTCNCLHLANDEGKQRGQAPSQWRMQAQHGAVLGAAWRRGDAPLLRAAPRSAGTCKHRRPRPAAAWPAWCAASGPRQQRLSTAAALAGRCDCDPSTVDLINRMRCIMHAISNAALGQSMLTVIAAAVVSVAGMLHAACCILHTAKH